MSPIKYCLTVASLLAAGCASVPAETTANVGAPSVQDGGAATAAVVSKDDPSVVQLEVKPMNPGGVISCREVLQSFSNVIVTRCMSQDDWRRFKSQQAQQAREILRTMQGGAFR